MRFSASGLKSLKQCPRQFAFKYLAKLPRGETPEAFAFGSRCHKIAEDWLRDHKTPDSTTYEGRLFLAGVQHLPLPKTVEVERKFEWTDLDGNDWISFLDFCDLNSGLIGDHKFQVQPKKWGLSEATLPDDLAAIIYAIALAREGVTNGKYLWVYYDKTTKSRPDAYAVAVEWNAADVQARHEKQIVPLVKRAKALEIQLGASGLTALEFAQSIDNDPNACGGCGRNCDFAEHCNIWNTKPVERTNDMGRFDDLFGTAEETKVEETKVEETKVEETKVEETKAEAVAPKAEAPKAEAPKAEAPKAVETSEDAKFAAPKAEAPKAEAPKAVETSEDAKFAALRAQLSGRVTSGVNPPEAKQALEETAKEVMGLEPAKAEAPKVEAPKAARKTKKAEPTEAAQEIFKDTFEKKAEPTEVGAVSGVDIDMLTSLVAKKLIEALSNLA